MFSKLTQLISSVFSNNTSSRCRQTPTPVMPGHPQAAAGLSGRSRSTIGMSGRSRIRNRLTNEKRLKRHRQQRVGAALKTQPNAINNNDQQKVKTVANKPTSSSGGSVLETFSLKGTGLSDDRPACLICEELDLLSNLVPCKKCGRTWHAKCLGEDETLDVFVCVDCNYETTGVGSCHKCNGTRDDECGKKLIRCAKPLCPHLYHAECLIRSNITKELDLPSNSASELASKSTKGRTSESKKELKQEVEQQEELEPVVCPVHDCLTCSAFRNVCIGRSVPIVQCLYCPVAYHSHDDCIPAGTESINRCYIICPAHIDSPHFNAPYCLMCSKHVATDELVCCDKCPISAHLSCLELKKRPDGPYICEKCSRGRRLLYKDIVYVKMGYFRPWPARIVPPAEIPTRIANLPHSSGQFCVLFYPKSQGYHWTDQLHTFRMDLKDTVVSRDSKKYRRGMVEALEALKTVTQERLARVSKHPPKYHKIKRNVYVDVAPKRIIDDDEEDSCVCTVARSCSDVDCLMREKHYECTKATCPVSSTCQNQRFTKRQNAPTKLVHTIDCGWGVVAAATIASGTFIAEYCGEVISRTKLAERLEQKHLDGDCHFYFLSLDKQRVIDAEQKGNVTRFINHSCDPNCHAELWIVNRVARVGIFAVREIEVGTEITFNYDMKYDENSVRIPCKCGTSNCKQFIGGDGTSQQKSAKAKLLPVPKKQRKSKPRRVEDDECFHCGSGGQLVMCDFMNCPRGYHDECLPPDDQRKHRKWFCPWHFCDMCVNQSHVLCAMCSNSYCKNHAAAKNISMQADGRLICSSHDEFVLTRIELSNIPAQRDQLQALVDLRRKGNSGQASSSSAPDQSIPIVSKLNLRTLDASAKPGCARRPKSPVRPLSSNNSPGIPQEQAPLTGKKTTKNKKQRLI